MAVPFMDLSRMPREADAAIRSAVTRVLDHRQFILGPEVLAFESEMSKELAGFPVLGVSSGTDALLLALMAEGIGSGDRVVTSPFSFFATAGVVVRLGATPVFVDIEPRTFGLCPRALAAAPRDGVKVIIPVHLFGETLDLDPVFAWAGNDITVLEDACQSIGGFDAQGRPAGTRGKYGAFSFFPTKNLGALGDAGMLVTRDQETFERLRRLRAHGQSSQYHHTEVGGNFRLDALQAAALRAGLPFLKALTADRRKNALGYEQRFSALGVPERGVVLPEIHDRHTVHQYVVRIQGGRRDAVLAGLKSRGIGAMVYYPTPFHLQPCFRNLGYARGDFPESERAAEEVLALPIFPGLSERELDAVAENVAALV